jgi:DNA-binding CsgD family transcriptional regulator
MDSRFLAALPAIYDAATSAEKWPQALDEIASAIGARGTLLTATDLVGLPFQVRAACSVFSPEDVEYYFTNFGHYEQAGLELLSKTPVGIICRDTDIWPDSNAIRDREDYVFLRQHYGVANRGAVALSKGRGWSDALYVQTGENWSQIPGAFFAELQALVPHLAKVVEVNRTFTLLRLRFQAALAALDHLGFGMCIASGAGEIVIANEEARRILAEENGLQLARNGHLVAHNDNITREIRAAIELTARTADGEAQRQEIAIACPRTAARVPLLVEVCPLRDAAGELERRFLGSLVCIIDPDATRDLSSEGLGKLFQFSPAETAVCDELLRGRTARDIADIRGVAHDTVRSQIKALYTKTNVANRVELIRLAIATNPPIR